MLSYAQRADAGTAATMGNREGLVQVEVADVATELPRFRQADQRVEVGAVDVHLRTGRVDLIAHFANMLFVDAVGRGVRDHDGGNFVALLLQLRVQVIKIDGPVVARFHRNNFQPSQCRRCRVGAVGGLRDQADGALIVVARLVVAANSQQTSEFALGSRVGLHADSCVTGHLGQTVLQIVDKFTPPRRLIVGSHGVNRREARPRDRLHLYRRVQFHRA